MTTKTRAEIADEKQETRQSLSELLAEKRRRNGHKERKKREDKPEVVDKLTERFSKTTDDYLAFLDSDHGRKVIADGYTEAQLRASYASSKRKRKYTTGDNHHNSKYTDAEFRAVRALHYASKLMDKSPQHSTIAKMLNMTPWQFRYIKAPNHRPHIQPTEAQVRKALTTLEKLKAEVEASKAHELKSKYAHDRWEASDSGHKFKMNQRKSTRMYTERKHREMFRATPEETLANLYSPNTGNPVLDGLLEEVAREYKPIRTAKELYEFVQTCKDRSLVQKLRQHYQQLLRTFH
ncbi:hypothetical protein AB4304_13965 [Vibrio breoganii]